MSAFFGRFRRWFATALLNLAEPFDLDGVKLLVLRAHVHAEDGRADLAVADFSRVLEKKPAMHAARMKRANLRIEIQDFAGAVSDADACIRAGYDVTEAFVVRGLANRLSGNLAEAIQDYSHAVSRSPKRGELYFHRGLTLMDAHRYVEADVDFQSAWDLGFQDLEGLVYRGDCRFALHATAEALALYRRAVDQGLWNGRLARGLVFSLFILRRMSEAIEEFTVRPPCEDLDGAIRTAVGWAYFAIGRITEAEASFRIALQRRPECLDAAFGIAWIFADSRRAIHRDAVVLACIQRATSTESDAGEPHFVSGRARRVMRAYLYADQERFEEAASAIERLLEECEEEHPEYLVKAMADFLARRRNELGITPLEF